MWEDRATTWRAEGGGTNVAVVERPAHLPRGRPGGTNISSSKLFYFLLHWAKQCYYGETHDLICPPPHYD